MPESVTDRPTKAHEYVFLLSKASRYFFDQEAVKERAIATNDHDATGQGYAAPGQSPHTGTRSKRDSFKRTGSKRETTIPGQTYGTHRPNRPESEWDTRFRNIRSVWTIATSPCPEAHFATMPPELAERCIKAGSAPGDTVLDPFAGSGTTLGQAVRLGRNAVGCELNPAYIEIAHRRIARMLGHEPGQGMLFDGKTA